MALTDDEQKQLVSLLAKLEPGFYPIEIFWQFARLNVLPIIELVPLRLSSAGEVEVLLLERPADDPYWPGQIHTPGTVVRPTDVDDSMLPFQRIASEELHSTPLSEAHFVGELLHQSQRGVEQARIFWAEVVGEPLAGRFYPVNDLPEHIVTDQVGFIARAAQSFLEARQQNP